MSIESYIEQSKKLLNQLSGFITAVDTEHKFVWANDKATHLYGFQTLDALVGQKYANLKCAVPEKACSYEANEKIILFLKKSFSFVCCNYYGDSWRLFLGEKSPIMNDEGDILGVINHWNDITNFLLVDIARFVVGATKKGIDSSMAFSYRIEDEETNSYKLSNRQLECLFFLLRGKSDKEIGKILNLSPRTVESYVQEIKHKMQCSTRSQIIEMAFVEGLTNICPRNVIQNLSKGIVYH